MLESQKSIKLSENNDEEEGEIDDFQQIERPISLLLDEIPEIPHQDPSIIFGVEYQPIIIEKPSDEDFQSKVVPPKTSPGHVNPIKRKKRGGKKKKKNKNNKKPSVLKYVVPTCKFYIEGRCHRGVDCEFRHEGPLNLKKEPCKFFIRDGYCQKGPLCVYMHSEFPCKFHFWGNCKQAEGCRFYHGQLTDEMKEALNLHVERTSVDPDSLIQENLVPPKI